MRTLAFHFSLTALAALGSFKNQAQDLHFDLEAGVGFSLSEASWQEQTGFEPTTLGNARVISDLEYEDITSLQLHVAGELMFAPQWGISAQMMIGDLQEGDGSDTDTVDGSTLDGLVFSKSTHDLEGENNSFQLRMLHRRDWQKGQVDFFAGVLSITDELVARNGVQTMVDDLPVNEPFAGLNSTYDFKWKGIELGAIGHLPLNGHWTLEAELGLMPLVDYEGEGFWNLRDDFKRTPPNFVHDADDGFGWGVGLRLEYALEGWTLFGDYHYRSMEVDDGFSETYFVDGGVAISGQEAEASWHSLVFGASYRF